MYKIFSSILYYIEKYCVDYIDVDYSLWVSWLLLPLILSFLLPLVIVLLLYMNAVILYIYKLHRYTLRDAFGTDIYDGARKLIAAIWDAHGYIWHGYEVKGLENIPESTPALFIYYHGAIPIDLYYFLSRVFLLKNRLIHTVGDRFLFKIPGWAIIAEALKVIPGTIQSCSAILKENNLLAISPGGVYEAQFSDSYYRLCKVALLAGWAIIAEALKVIPGTIQSCSAILKENNLLAISPGGVYEAQFSDSYYRLCKVALVAGWAIIAEALKVIPGTIQSCSAILKENNLLAISPGGVYEAQFSDSYYRLCKVALVAGWAIIAEALKVIPGTIQSCSAILKENNLLAISPGGVYEAQFSDSYYRLCKVALLAGWAIIAEALKVIPGTIQSCSAILKENNLLAISPGGVYEAQFSDSYYRLCKVALLAGWAIIAEALKVIPGTIQSCSAILKENNLLAISPGGVYEAQFSDSYYRLCKVALLAGWAIIAEALKVIPGTIQSCSAILKENNLLAISPGGVYEAQFSDSYYRLCKVALLAGWAIIAEALKVIPGTIQSCSAILKENNLLAISPGGVYEAQFSDSYYRLCKVALLAGWAIIAEALKVIPGTIQSCSAILKENNLLAISPGGVYEAQFSDSYYRLCKVALVAGWAIIAEALKVIPGTIQSCSAILKENNLLAISPGGVYEAQFSDSYYRLCKVALLAGWAIIAEALKVIPGTIQSCSAILKENNLLAISPGGVYEAQFSDSYYRLMWKKRLGFARVALEAQVPIIPIFTQNVRESFRAVGFFRRVWLKLYQWTKFPLVPIYGGFPVKLRTHVGAPIPYDSSLSPEDLAAIVASALEELIANNQRIPGSILRALMERFYEPKTSVKNK